jgi:predicted N-acyltransferase
MPIVTADSIEAFGRAEWDRLFPGENEDWAYYRAIERARIPGFQWLYFGVRAADGELRAAVPAFVTDYRLDTTLAAPLRRITMAISRVFPRFLRQRLLSLGSPIGEICHLGFAPGCSDRERAELLGRILDEAERQAATRRVSLLAAKDANAAQDALWSEGAGARGLRRQPSLPTASLDLRFDSIDAYLATLSRATRRDLRRKLRASATLRVEWRSDIDDVIDDVVRLYRQTLAHAQFSFEELTPEFFREVLRAPGGRARCAIWRDGERVVAFNLVVHDDATMIDKFLGMDYAVARRHNLYYATWLENLRYCIAHGLRRYQAGQGLHREKLRLGCRLTPNWLWYRHRNRMLDAIFAAFERWFHIDRADPVPGAPQAPRRQRPYLAWSGFLACAALSQIAFKLAARDTGEVELTRDWLLAALGSAWLWVSLASHLGEFALWMTILARSALSRAFATSAVLFVVVMLAGWLLFAEPLGWRKLAGSAAILAGLLLLGDEHDESPDASGAGADGTPPDGAIQ